MNQHDNKSRIRQIVSLIDLTNLNDDCDQAAIETLCAQAKTPVGYVAAVCIWPAYLSSAKEYLSGDSEIQIATVVNFPTGDEPQQVTSDQIRDALANGATEIDYVLDFKKIIHGNTDTVAREIKNVRNSIPEQFKLKVILETGELRTENHIRVAANIAINEGADFIKTSTGKVSVSATPEAAIIMLDAIAQSKHDTGFKASGGIKTVADANVFLNLAESQFGSDWINPSHFRFGASGLLQNALNELESDQSSEA